jgi:hypothetical protein
MGERGTEWSDTRGVRSWLGMTEAAKHHKPDCPCGCGAKWTTADDDLDAQSKRSAERAKKEVK